MPDQYRHPKSPPDSTNASFFVLTGPGTVFDGGEGTRIRDVRDGFSSTLMIVEAKREIPWTKPEDIPYDPDEPLPGLGGYDDAGFAAALVDGSVHLIPKTLDEQTLRRLITRADGEVIDWKPIANPSK
jgi:hypothetical protein